MELITFLLVYSSKINPNLFTMKKLSVALFLLLSITFVAQQAKAQVDFGIRGGVNFASLNDTDLDAQSNVGFTAGFYLQYPIANSPIVIQPEVLYSQKGFELEAGGNTGTANFSYLEVPVLVKFNYVLEGPLTPYVTAGPYVAFLLDSSSEFNDQTVENDLENLKTVDFGVAVGAGFDYQRFNLGVRYSAGLTPVFEDDDLSAKNGVFSIVAGFSF